MADIFSPEKRSQIMSRIRSSHTKPEERFHEVLRKCLGHRWRIDRNVLSMPGQPDFLIPALRLVLFVDGCFYHGCPRHGHIPRSRVSYWSAKLAGNVARDGRTRRKLREMGFGVWSFWEHDLKPKRIPVTEGILRRRLTKRIAAFRAGCVF